MADENILPRDQNHVTTAGFENSLVAGDVRPGQIIVATGRVKVDSSGGGSGTVTDFSFTDANGFAGVVTNSTTTPNLTLTTTVTTGALIKASSGALAAAVAGTDYANLTFKTISVSGQSDVVADSAADTLTLVAGTNITITTNAGTDSITINSSGGASGITIGTTTITSGTTTRILYDNAGVVGEYTLTGTGTVVAMQTSPVFVTDATTPVIKLSGTSNQAIFQSGGVTGTLTWTPTTTGKTITLPDRTLTVDNITTATTTNGTGFVKGNGTAISFDNSTYLSTLTVGATTITSGTTTRILYDNAGVLGEYTLTGSGTVVMMQTAPTFITSMTGPLLIGGSGTTGTQLTLQTTSGNGTTDALVIKGGNNGATTFATFSAALLALATGSITMTGSLAATGARVTKGWFTDIESTNVPTVGGVALPTATSTTTFTNKRITPRVLSAASYTTDTGTSINGDTQDMFIVTAQTGALKFNNPTGTPTDGQKLIITVASSTTSARALTWDTLYGSTTVTLPTTTAATTATLSIGFIWSASKSLWQCTAVA